MYSDSMKYHMKSEICVKGDSFNSIVVVALFKDRKAEWNEIFQGSCSWKKKEIVRGVQNAFEQLEKLL